MLKWLLGRRAKPQIQMTVIELAGSCEYNFEVVGESHYQEVLQRIWGGRTHNGAEHECDARLVREPENPHDPNAVAVKIDGATVAHLSRRHAREFVATTQRLGIDSCECACGAMIVGGWARPSGSIGHFGVKLDLDWPISVAS